MAYFLIIGDVFVQVCELTRVISRRRTLNDQAKL